MIQRQVNGSEIKGLIERCNGIYEELLEYVPKQTKLRLATREQWADFSGVNGLNANINGVYVPKTQTAIVPVRDELYSFGIFHNYFGKGLYHEQTQNGRELIRLEDELAKEEKEFPEKTFLSQRLQWFKERDLRNQTNFALFTEHFLSEKLGLEDKFQKIYDSLQGEVRENLDEIISFSKKYGDLATFYNFGMAKRTTPERAKKLFTEVYRDQINDVRLALLMGSRKEFSDVDFCVVSDSFKKTKNVDFVDIAHFSPELFEQTLRLFNAGTMDHLISGEFVFGDRAYYEQLKSQAFSQPITSEAIVHNLEGNFNMVKLQKEHERLGRVYGEFAKTHSAMAFALRNKKRIFTKNELLKFLKGKKDNQNEPH